VQINHRQPTEHEGGEVDHGSWAGSRALAEAHQWLQRHGVDAPDGVTDQPVRRMSEHPADGTHGLSLSKYPPGPSQPADDIDAEAESVAHAIALRMLTSRARTRQELARALRAKNVPQDVIDAVLDRLKEVGLVDDASFAERWVSARQQRRHLSRRLLRRELQAKGVEQDHIDRAVAQVDRDAELSSARDLVERKQAAMNGLSRDVQYRRLAGMLSRRGFDTAVTTQVLAEVLGE
jgi:regulatory protein